MTIGPGVLAVYFTRDIAEHTAALRPLVAPDAQLEVRSATWTLEQLERFSSDIQYNEAAWLEERDASLSYTSVLIHENAVEVVIAGPARAAADFAAHLGHPGWLRLVNAGAPWSGPTGTLVVQAVDRAGRPMRRAGLDCWVKGHVVGAYTDPGVAIVTDDRGRCVLPGVGASTYTVELREQRGGDFITLGSSDAVVPAAGEGIAEVPIDP